jgi:hypothetical protein
MSFNIKTEQGLERIHSVRVKPSTAGKTITDYAGQSAAPTEFYAKYRKQNF